MLRLVMNGCHMVRVVTHSSWYWLVSLGCACLEGRLRLCQPCSPSPSTTAAQWIGKPSHPRSALTHDFVLGPRAGFPLWEL